MGLLKDRLWLIVVVLNVVFIVAFQLEYSRIKSELALKKEQIFILENKNTLCNGYIDMQNLAIKALEIKDINSTTKEIEQVKKVFVKDKTCQSELNAYRALFGAVK